MDFKSFYAALSWAEKVQDKLEQNVDFLNQDCLSGRFMFWIHGPSIKKENFMSILEESKGIERDYTGYIEVFFDYNEIKTSLRFRLDTGNIVKLVSELTIKEFCDLLEGVKKNVNK